MYRNVGFKKVGKNNPQSSPPESDALPLGHGALDAKRLEPIWIYERFANEWVIRAFWPPIFDIGTMQRACVQQMSRFNRIHPRENKNVTLVSSPSRIHISIYLLTLLYLGVSLMLLLLRPTAFSHFRSFPFPSHSIQSLRSSPVQFSIAFIRIGFQFSRSCNLYLLPCSVLNLTP